MKDLSEVFSLGQPRLYMLEVKKAAGERDSEDVEIRRKAWVAIELDEDQDLFVRYRESLEMMGRRFDIGYRFYAVWENGPAPIDLKDKEVLEYITGLCRLRSCVLLANLTAETGQFPIPLPPIRHVTPRGIPNIKTD